MSKFKVNDLIEVITDSVCYNSRSLKYQIFKVLGTTDDTVMIEIEGRKFDLDECYLKLHKKYMSPLEFKLEELKVDLESKLMMFQEKYTDDDVYEIGKDDPHDAFQLGWDEGNMQGQLKLIEELRKSMIIQKD